VDIITYSSPILAGAMPEGFMRAEGNKDAILNKWLAEIISSDKIRIIDLWISNLRESGRSYYAGLSDSDLYELLFSTLSQMILALNTGQGDIVKEYMHALASDYMRKGMTLGDIEQALHDFRTAVMSIICQHLPTLQQQIESLETIYNLHDHIALIVSDAYQLLQQEQQQRFVAAYNLGVSLSKSLDLLTVMRTAADQVKDKIGAHFVAIVPAAVNGEPSAAVFTGNVGPDVCMHVAQICLALGCGPDTAKSESISAVSYKITDISKSRELLPWMSMLLSHGCLSMAGIPLWDKGKFIGCLLCCFNEPRSFPDYEIDFLLALSSHIAMSMHNAMLYEEAKGKRELSVLLEASKLFTATLELSKVLNYFAKFAVKAVDADFSFIFMPVGTELGLHVAATYAHPGHARILLEKLLSVWGQASLQKGRSIIGVAYERGKSLFIPQYSKYPARIRELEGVIGSLFVCPLKSRGRMLGVLGLASAKESAFNEEHLATVYGLANQAAVAVDNAELFERQRNIANTLQKSFLPSYAPDIPGFEFAVRYKAALQESDVGGDFYDAFRLRDGRFAILVADVSGKGLSAAVHTAMGKYIIRAYAAENPLPSNVLERANRALEQYLSEELFITAFYGVLDPKNGLLAYASAGHEPPMFYSSADGSVTSLDVTGPGLGSIAGMEYGDREIAFNPGDTLFMYTDGATDIRRNHEMLGWEGLCNLYKGALGKPAEDVAEYVFQEVLKYGGQHLSDDIAIIVLKRSL